MLSFKFGDTVILRESKNAEVFKGFFVPSKGEKTSWVRSQPSLLVSGGQKPWLMSKNKRPWVMIVSNGTVLNVEMLKTCRLVLVEKRIRMF